MLMEQLALHKDSVALALSPEDIRNNAAQGIASALLSVEDGRMIDNDMNRIAWMKEMGVRAIGLTWNHANCLGFPNSPDPEENRKGLTPFGRDAVEEMNRLGILVDVSHLSDGGFDDVAEISRKPFVASHSNARAVTDQPRNLSDPMLKKLADRGGVTGLNLVPEFLNDRNLPGTVAMLMEHARHIVRVAGEDVLGIGSDLDGFSEPSEISCASQIVLLFSAMEKEFTPRQIDKFASGNVLRVLADQ
jgi:membrane dipeptidase